MNAKLLMYAGDNIFGFDATDAAASMNAAFAPALNPAEDIDGGDYSTHTSRIGSASINSGFFTMMGKDVLWSKRLNEFITAFKHLYFFPQILRTSRCMMLGSSRCGNYYFPFFSLFRHRRNKLFSPSSLVQCNASRLLPFKFVAPPSNLISNTYQKNFSFLCLLCPTLSIAVYLLRTFTVVIWSFRGVRLLPLILRSSLNTSILVNYGRFSSGSEQWGPGFSNDTDRFGRSWQSDAEFRFRNTEIENGGSVKAISAIQDIVNVDKPPNYFPLKLYQTAVTVVGEGHEFLEYILPVDAKLDYLLCFHFAEIDVSVNRKGKRVFDVVVNGENVTRVDIYEKVGGFAAYDWNYVVKNLNSTTLNVRLVPVVGAPVICGLENYAIVPADLRTAPDQAVAMKALKESLRVPDRMGWNGDPCAPTTWDAWEGVTCRQPKGESRLVISQIDLGSQGLKGYISDKISLLSNLVSLNLSSNSLGGSLPQGIGQKSLVKLDLSNNKFTGFIPDSLTSSSLQLMLLNGNSLEGRVPSELYSIGVHGGAIDLSDNKGLCGVPSLPDCSLFWDKHGLSTAGKVGIGIASLVIFLLLLCLGYWCYKRRQNDYDFGLPHELMSLSAKRNRYHRQKSLMALEMESQHAKGFIPTYNSN
nr:putative leucine-rich repeat receptor-like serine/threonine-protein kinase At2g14440 [Ipomoea batatas]